MHCSVICSEALKTRILAGSIILQSDMFLGDKHLAQAEERLKTAFAHVSEVTCVKRNATKKSMNAHA